MFQLGFYELLLVGLLALVLLDKNDFIKLCFLAGKGLKFLQTHYTTLKAELKKATAPLELEEFSQKAQKKAAEKEPLLKKNPPQKKEK